MAFMGIFGCGAGLLAALFFLIGLIPFLGWINWITTLPLAAVAASLSYVALRQDRRNSLAALGLTASVILILVALFRLSLGGGFV
jgi:hypothetical protein